ncbi:hypothetical protein NDK43_31210 [Neobacillus pocheonensis]|uniref:Photosynthesis system II assembly factor Ycf48/Hcf136-like domain-containing protein n=1 Tax=Neobacillus pocheonensis TaxID=363869 RepID=A0ABT0WJU1_9BACI|nr:hypothetical protein [Neobacillus pocheonensis]
MLKNKILMMVLGLSLILAGCSSANNQKASQSSHGTTASNKQSNQQTSNSDSSANNTNVGSSSSTGTSTNSSNTTSNSSTLPETNTAEQSNTIDRSTVTAVRLADFNTGWVGGNGWIAKTITSGKNWKIVYQGSGTVQQIFALNHSDVWAILNQGSNNGKLLQSSDGGQHWALIGTTPNKAYLHFTSKTTAISGNIYSQDGGKTWYSLPIPKDMVGDAYFHDVKNGWAVTQSNNVFYVKRTIDGGKSWNTVMTKNLSSPLAGAMIRSAGTNDAWIELIGGTGMTQTSYSVFHTTDGGNSWNTVIANSTAGGGPAPGFNQDYNKGPINKGSKPGPLYVVNPQVAFMGGSCPACDNPNSIGWTKDAGKTWVNSNVTLAGYGDAYLAISDASHGWWITTENTKPSVMYTTSDGGIHWNQVHIFR